MALVTEHEQALIMEIIAGQFIAVEVETWMVHSLVYEGGRIKVRFADPETLVLTFPKGNPTQEGMVIISGTFHKDPTHSEERGSPHLH